MGEKPFSPNFKCRAQEVFISPTFLRKYDEKIKKKQEITTIENRKWEKNQKTQKKRKNPEKIEEITANGKKSNPYSREPLESYHKIFENSEKFQNFQCFWTNSKVKMPEELMKCANF